MSKSNEYKTIRITKEVSELLDNLKISNESYDTVIKQLIKDNDRLTDDNKTLHRILLKLGDD